MSKYFCVYCDVDLNRRHVVGCPRYRTPEESAEQVMEDFNKFVRELAEAGGYKIPDNERNPNS